MTAYAETKFVSRDNRDKILTPRAETSITPRLPANLSRSAQAASSVYGADGLTAGHWNQSTAENTWKRLHPGVYSAFIICWTLLFGVVALTFLGNLLTMFVIAIGTFAVLLLNRVRPAVGEAVTFRDFLRGKFDTLTGPVRGWEALLHVILAPAAMSLATLAIAFIVNASRTAS